MNHLTVKENTFTLEINESQSTKNFSVVVLKLTETIYTQEFDSLKTAIETGKAIFKAVVKLGNYRDLADKAKQEALLAQKDKDFVREALFLQQANFYKQKYLECKASSVLNSKGEKVL
jgi:hypothetical protein